MAMYKSPALRMYLIRLAALMSAYLAGRFATPPLPAFRLMRWRSPPRCR